MSAALAYPPPTVTEINGAPLMPVDPESLDATRPEDLDVCPECRGEGAIQVRTDDPYPGAWDGEECWACSGTGERGAA